MPKIVNKQRLPLETKVGHGKAHGKVILMGEHAVVYDQLAIAVPVPTVSVYAMVRASQTSGHYLTCRYYEGLLAQAPQHLENIVAAIDLALKHTKGTSQALHITIESEIPQERGMGSSAAVAVAVVRAVCDYYKVEVSDEALRYMVNQAEVIAHGNPSGLDTWMTSTMQPVLYQKGHTPSAFQMQMGGYLVIADSGQAGRTKEAVQQVRTQLTQEPELTAQQLVAIGEFVKQAHQAILSQDLVQLGRLMTYNHYYLSRFGISTPELDQLVKAAWLAGALGAKLTGGGLGGCVIALAATPEVADKVADAMRINGAKQTWTMAV